MLVGTLDTLQAIREIAQHDFLDGVMKTKEDFEEHMRERYQLPEGSVVAPYRTDISNYDLYVADVNAKREILGTMNKTLKDMLVEVVPINEI